MYLFISINNNSLFCFSAERAALEVSPGLFPLHRLWNKTHEMFFCVVDETLRLHRNQSVDTFVSSGLSWTSPTLPTGPNLRLLLRPPSAGAARRPDLRPKGESVIKPHVIRLY